MLSYLENPEKRVVFLWGPRQVGKSTILRELFSRYKGTYLNFDDLEDQRLFVPESSKLDALLKFRSTDPNSRFVFIDEVQKHPDSTQAIKLLCDTTDRIVIATGSSELKAKTQTFDALTGRFIEFTLYPLSIDEVAHFIGDEPLREDVDPAIAQRLVSLIEPYCIYGGYPFVTLAQDKIGELKQIANTSIVKDVMDIYNLKNSTLVYNLLRMLALQIGNLVNVSEVARSLGASKVTIANYLDILVKNRIIHLLPPFRTNARQAIAERQKVYFVDIGIRNALVDDFRPLAFRPDAGSVFENIVVMGALRQANYRRTHDAWFFYRERNGAEIDLLTRRVDGSLSGYEIKLGKGSVTRPSNSPVSNIERIGQMESIRFLI